MRREYLDVILHCLMRSVPRFPSNRRRHLAGVTLLELVVVLAVVGLLIALLLPALGQARQAALRAQCTSNLRNISIGLSQFEHVHSRFPASGYYFDPPNGQGGAHHTWAVSILPFVEQGAVYEKWDLNKPINDAANQRLTQSFVPVFACPADVTLNPRNAGDLSYAVNGGWGFTFRTSAGVGDCALSPQGALLDLNGDGMTCQGTSADEADQKLFKQLGLFFLENWDPKQTPDSTVRHHSMDDIIDGTSQTFLVTENVRAGYDPSNPEASFADPNPFRSAFYVGSPCRNGNCSQGNVDAALANSGDAAINSGLLKSEGNSPVPNSYHAGGVNMAYADGHVSFLSELVDSSVYLALASPQGILITGPLSQVVVSGEY